MRLIVSSYMEVILIQLWFSSDDEQRLASRLGQKSLLQEEWKTGRQMECPFCHSLRHQNVHQEEVEGFSEETQTQPHLG